MLDPMFGGFLILLVLVAYLIVTPRDTLSELKQIFDLRVLRRGLRLRLPRRLPRLKLPAVRFSIFTIMVVTAVIASYIGFMQAWEEPLFNAILIAIVLLICAVVVVLVACNTQGRGVLRQQRADYRRTETDRRKQVPAIKVDTAEPRHVVKTFDGSSFPELEAGADE